MVFRMIREKARIARELKTLREGRKANVDWILSNRQELMENFPNKWAAVSEETVQLADNDIIRLYSIIEQREDSPFVVYYCCNNAIPPMAFVRSEEVEVNEYVTAEA